MYICSSRYSSKRQYTIGGNCGQYNAVLLCLAAVTLLSFPQLPVEGGEAQDRLEHTRMRKSLQPGIEPAPSSQATDTAVLFYELSACHTPHSLPVLPVWGSPSSLDHVFLPLLLPTLPYANRSKLATGPLKLNEPLRPVRQPALEVK